MKKENKDTFNYKSVEEILAREDKFIMNLFSNLPMLDLNQKQDSDEEDMSADESKMEKVNETKTQRATSLQELQKRLENIKRTKKKLSYKDKLLKKGIKNRIKKKSRQDDRNVEQKLKRAAKLMKSENGVEDKGDAEQQETSKPVFNKDDVMVYSKIDFANLGKNKTKKQKKDPKQLLKDLQNEQEKLKKLEEEGEVQKAREIKEKTAWKNALAKAQGEKVKDDPVLLKKTVQRKEQKVRSSKKKWEARVEGVQKAKDDRQKKRQDNLDKRKKEKKVKKLKKAVKKGKIVAGL